MCALSGLLLCATSHCGPARRLQELLIQQRSLRNLILRNRDAPLDVIMKAAGDGTGGGTGPTPLQLPFIIIQVSIKQLLTHLVPSAAAEQYETSVAVEMNVASSFQGTEGRCIGGCVLTQASLLHCDCEPPLAWSRRRTRRRWSCRCRTTRRKSSLTSTSAPDLVADIRRALLLCCC